MKELDSTSSQVIESLSTHIREKLNDDQLYIHLNLFIKFDKDGSGYVDSDELKSMLEELGFGDVSHDDCVVMIADLDADNTCSKKSMNINGYKEIGSYIFLKVTN